MNLCVFLVIIIYIIHEYLPTLLIKYNIDYDKFRIFENLNNYNTKPIVVENYTNKHIIMIIILLRN